MLVNKGVKISAHKLNLPLRDLSQRTASVNRFDTATSGAVIRYSRAKNHTDYVTDQISITDQPTFLSCSDLIDKIIYALDNSQQLSVVSVGATEAFVMAQYTIYPEEEFMNHGEAYNANLGMQNGFFHRGVRFPNIEARNEAVSAVRQADIVGYNTIVDDARKLTEQVFSVYNIQPQYIFEANLRRVLMFSQGDKFEQMLKNRKILLIGSLAAEAEEALNRKLKERLNFDIVGTISILEYEELPRVRVQVSKYDFDLCFISAGVNALILAPYIANMYGKVAIDIGWGMQSFITDQIVTDAWIDEIIGLERLMKM
ncbi:MAG: hypothetical protein GX808_13670 [Syntrophomonadaceae bacterium]|nr:hypothetical protein [Syntrophomonadaceae bacterium]